MAPAATPAAAPKTTAPAASTAPITLVVSHPSTLSGAQILSIVNSAVDEDVPVVLQAIPSSSPQVTAYAALGEIGLGIVNQIVQAIAAAHAASTPAA